MYIEIDILNIYKLGGNKVMTVNTTKLNLLMANRMLTMRELSEESGVSLVTLARLKAGTQVSRPQTLGKVAFALGVKVEDLI